MSGWAVAFGILGVLTASGGVVSWFTLRPMLRKHRADTSKTIIDAAVAERSQNLAEDSAEDEHWNSIVRAQVDVLITPLQNEVKGLRTRLEELESKFAALHIRYWRAIEWIRHALRWIDTFAPDAKPPPPNIPPEIADDL